MTKKQLWLVVAIWIIIGFGISRCTYIQGYNAGVIFEQQDGINQ